MRSVTTYRLAFTDSIAAAFRPRGAPGRWNSKGTIVVYTAEHPALAALELLAAWADYEDFGRYHLYRCRIGEDAVLDASPRLAASGLELGDLGATRAFGDAWVASKEAAALRVPSVMAPFSYNYLLNPDHPDFESRIEREAIGPFRYDARLLELLESAKGR